MKVADALRTLQRETVAAPSPPAPSPEASGASKSSVERLERTASPRSSINYDDGSEPANGPPRWDASPLDASSRPASKTAAGAWILFLALLAAGGGARAQVRPW